VIVIDTLSRVMAGGNENAPEDMTALIRNLDAIREHTGAHIMVVHHTGKDTARGARGHSSLRAATDTEIEVANENGVHTAQVTKQRDYQGGETFTFTLKSISLGHDPDGDPVGSCVVEWSTDAAPIERKRKLSKNQQLLVEVYDMLRAEGIGRTNPGGPGWPEIGHYWIIPVEQLRAASIGKMVLANPRQAFNDAFEALRRPGGVFQINEGSVWRHDRKFRQ
jgi:AAA domain-containing protein